MDAAFVTTCLGIGAVFAWLPVRDAICARRGHKIGSAHLRGTFEDGSYETEQVCMCRSHSIVTRKIAFARRKEPAWVAPASGQTLGTSPSP